MSPDCGGDRLLVPGATGAAFGPADAGAATSGPAAGAASAAVTRLSLHPRTFKTRKGTKVRFTLSAPAPVKLSAGRVSMTVGGRAGVNTVRFKKRLKPGRYRLRVSAGTTATAKFRVER